MNKRTHSAAVDRCSEWLYLALIGYNIIDIKSMMLLIEGGSV
jgi:hypothetical protein